MVLLQYRSSKLSSKFSKLSQERNLSRKRGFGNDIVHVEQLVTCSNCRITRCSICIPGPCRNCGGIHVNRYTIRC